MTTSSCSCRFNHFSTNWLKHVQSCAHVNLFIHVYVRISRTTSFTGNICETGAWKMTSTGQLVILPDL